MIMKKTSPWAWIPTLYFAQGLPYVAVMTISVIMYKRLGISNAELAFYTGWLNLPWVIKPLWSPFIDLIKTKRWWTTWMQLLIGAGLAGIAFTIPTEYFFQLTLAVFWLLAFSSATHDIAADGFYMLGLNSHQQALFVGIRSTFYRIATIAGQGLLIMLAGYLESSTGNIPFAWSITFMVLAGLFLALWAYHKFILPHPASDKAACEVSASTLLHEFWATFVSFFKKKQAGIAILFMLLYRLPEAQLAKMSIPFLIDPINEGGLGLTTEQIGFVQGTVGIIGLTLGGILGGIAVSRHGLKRWLWPMVWAISLPDFVYVYLSYIQPSSLLLVNICVFVEQFGYGFGFTAYMLYLIYFADGEHKTAHYAICTAFMALGMMIPGMAAGWLQETMGYPVFFIWIMICTLATFGVTALLKIDPQFGKKNE
ncbi:MAG: AmpG family muropeptide MFS transporter [Bacteroides sp.]|nr:AmpG family muropeptide MFS transporter [Bacteroides sp.]